MTLNPWRLPSPWIPIESLSQDLRRGKVRQFSYNNCYYYCAYLSINAAYHVRPNITYSEEYNKILQIYPLYTYRDSYEINTNFTFIPFWIYITAGELSVHKWRWDNSYEKKLFDQRELPTGLGFSCVLQWSARDSSPLASVLTIKASLSALI